MFEGEPCFNLLEDKNYNKVFLIILYFKIFNNCYIRYRIDTFYIMKHLLV